MSDSSSIDWCDTEIGSQVTLQRGFDITKADQISGTVPVVSSGGTASFHNVAIVKAPGVVLGRKGVVGSVYYCEADFWPHDTTLWVKDFHGNHPRFVYYFFRSIAEDLALLDVGSANPTLNRNHVHPMRVAWPSPTIQRSIAEILGALDDRIELNRRMNRTLEALAKKLFKSWFVDFDPVIAKSEGRKPFGLSDELAALFPSEFQESEQGPIPKGWRVSAIGQEASIVGGSTPATDEPEYWTDGRHCWVTPRDLSRLEDPVLLDTERKITDSGLARISSGVLPAGTVLLSSRAPIGYVAVAGVPTAINQGFIAIRCDKTLPNQFVRQWVAENMAEIEARAGGTTFAEISKSAFRPIPVLVPSTELLEAFQAQAATLFDRLSQNVKQSNLLAKLRDLLLPRLLSGELRVPDAEREVEALL